MKSVRLHSLMLTLGVLLAFVLGAPSLQQAAYGQDVSGMTGVVTDPNGSAVPDAVVTLKNASTGAKYSVTTGPTGLYRFTNIPPGQGYEALFTARVFHRLISRISTLPYPRSAPRMRR